MKGKMLYFFLVALIAMGALLPNFALSKDDGLFGMITGLYSFVIRPIYTQEQDCNDNNLCTRDLSIFGRCINVQKCSSSSVCDPSTGACLPRLAIVPNVPTVDPKIEPQGDFQVQEIDPYYPPTYRCDNGISIETLKVKSNVRTISPGLVDLEIKTTCGCGCDEETGKCNFDNKKNPCPNDKVCYEGNCIDKCKDTDPENDQYTRGEVTGIWGKEIYSFPDYCSNGYLVQRECGEGPFISAKLDTSSCGQNEVCSLGRCIKKGTCEVDGDCEDGESCVEGACVVATGVECTDTDEGLNKFTFGTVTEKHLGTGGSFIYSDYCSNTNPKIVHEYYCSSSGAKQLPMDCGWSYVCDNGVCVDEQSSCESGTYICNKKMVRYCSNGKWSLPFTYSNCGATKFPCCNEEKGIDCVDTQTDRNNCGNCGNVCATGESCVDGACVVATGVECTDTDEGKNIYEKGTTIGKVKADSDTKEYEDKCVFSMLRYPFNKDILREYYCENGLVKVSTINCENGCVDGACKRVKDCSQDCKGELIGDKYCVDANYKVIMQSYQSRFCDNDECVDSSKYAKVVETCARDEICKDGACVKGCDDGTVYGECSSNKPFQCVLDYEGNYYLKQNCKLCDCPAGKDCNDLGYCEAKTQCGTNSCGQDDGNGGICMNCESTTTKFCSEGSLITREREYECKYVTNIGRYLCQQKGEYTESTVECENGCVDGACVREQAEPSPTVTPTSECEKDVDCLGLYPAKPNSICLSGKCQCYPDAFYSVCIEPGVQCGEVNNGCGGTHVCGYCSEGEECVDGACVGSPENPTIPTESSLTCVDRDEGNKPYVKGTITGLNYNKEQKTLTDSCSGNSLTEYYCSNNRITYTTVNCTTLGSGYICANGKCARSCLARSEACEGACGTVDDGCGRSYDCGKCQTGYLCTNNKCVEDPCDDGNPCTTDYPNTNMGGCYHEEKVCPPGQVCSKATGQCVDKVIGECTTACQDKECGRFKSPEGYLCQCGTCVEEKECNQNGICVEKSQETVENECQSDRDCEDGYRCVARYDLLTRTTTGHCELITCYPHCMSTWECGSDGCDGSCGTCGAGEKCVGHKCFTEYCGDFGSVSEAATNACKKQYSTGIFAYNGACGDKAQYFVSSDPTKISLNCLEKTLQWFVCKEVHSKPDKPIADCVTECSSMNSNPVTGEVINCDSECVRAKDCRTDLATEFEGHQIGCIYYSGSCKTAQGTAGKCQKGVCIPS